MVGSAGLRGMLIVALVGIAPTVVFAADESEDQDPFDPRRPPAAEFGYGLRIPDSGVPRLASPSKGRPILERLQEISAPYGTRIAIRKNVGVIRPESP